MNFMLWKEELVPDLDSAMGRAQAGAEYLDRKFGPRWDQVINVDRLDIASFRCVWGQLARHGFFCLPTPRRAVDCGFSCGSLMDLVVLLRLSSVPRSYERLTQAWKVVIRQRRRQYDRQAVTQRLRGRQSPPPAVAIA